MKAPLCVCHVDGELASIADIQTSVRGEVALGGDINTSSSVSTLGESFANLLPGPEASPRGDDSDNWRLSGREDDDDDVIGRRCSSHARAACSLLSIRTRRSKEISVSIADPAALATDAGTSGASNVVETWKHENKPRNLCCIVHLSNALCDK